MSLLKELAQDNPVCIVSGSSRQHIAHFIDKLEIKNEVNFYLGNEDYKIGKPHPECYLKAALKMKSRLLKKVPHLFSFPPKIPLKTPGLTDQKHSQAESGLKRGRTWTNSRYTSLQESASNR